MVIFKSVKIFLVLLFSLMLIPLIIFSINYEPNIDQRTLAKYQVWPISSYTLTVALHNSYLSIKNFFKNPILPQSISSNLKTISIKIKEQKINELNSHLPDSGFKWKNAVYSEMGQNYDIHTRYRGDSQWHWIYKHKSWRINKKDDLKNSYYEFDLTIPKTQSIIEEYLLMKWYGEYDSYFDKKPELVNLVVNNEWTGVSNKFETLESWAKQKNDILQIWSLDLNSICTVNQWLSSDCWNLVFSKKANSQLSFEMKILQNFLNSLKKNETSLVNFKQISRFYSFMLYFNIDHSLLPNTNVRLVQFIDGSWSLIPYDLLRFTTVIDVKYKLSHPIFNLLKNNPQFVNLHKENITTLKSIFSLSKVSKDIDLVHISVKPYIDNLKYQKVPSTFSYLGIDVHRSLFYIDPRIWKSSVETFSILTQQSIKAFYEK